MEPLTYEQFKQIYLQEIERLLKQRGYTIKPVIIGEGLSFENITLDLGEKICHSIDIQEVYAAHFKNNYPKFHIAEQTLKCFRDFGVVQREQVESKENILAFATNLNKSKETLEKARIPYLVIDDMAVYFKFIHEIPFGKTMESVVYDSHLQKWGCSVELVFNIAKQNKAQEIGACAVNWVELPEDKLFGRVQTIVDAKHLCYEPYDLFGLNGTGAMFYPEVLHEFEEVIHEHLIIVPYSEREAAVIPESCMREAWVQKELHQNIEKTEPRLKLSNHVYSYENGKLNRLKETLEEVLSAMSREADAVAVSYENVTKHKREGR
ncbi:DUF5688 family protein [Enterocloster clostridioformis]|uniref:Uncharacterized protein n=1 Tax=Enterocloster clostridioformis TaxID=1531 RepID=A0A2X2U1T7_9FIRM|nr:DUF5688 family protein [Enterocloster clostridioformis]MCA5577091.1 DUF5688 family protein [Enterocloster clostridioformis]SQB10334.1 Uncharacterised protein [Enterocloster clostridioformis]